MKDQTSKLLPLIAGFKIVKALSLFLLAYGLHHLRLGNAGDILEHWCKDIRLDPDDKVPHLLISKITGVPPWRLHQLGIGVFFYGLLFGTEGVGLLLKRRWAEYMTVISTVLFLPLEIFELFHPGRKLLKFLVLLANVLILIYLVRMLIKARQREKIRESLDPRIEISPP